jgi:4-amino-4-deoxy-L-arabinose transferase-like glycosyltransferase
VYRHKFSIAAVADSNHLMRVIRSSPTLSLTLVKALPIAAILIAFGLPLFLGLGAADLRNDESIYSYAVDRILETGDWLLPRIIPDDLPFLEKPPLKFWIVAAPIAAGVMPHDEVGQRAFDALFGAIAFVYVFLLGRSLGGLVCGGTAVLVLFSLPSLVFEHGLRSNNMEASLLLAYCGGIYHFGRWLLDQKPAAHGVWHAAAVTAYFVLGFMTKFVAAFFLPMICGAALLVIPGRWQRLWQSWRDWRWPVVAAIAFIAPWFVYQTQQFGAHFWRVILGAHVVARMTSYLDPQHVHPWNAYFVWTWRDFSAAGAAWLGIAGLARLAVGAWTGRPPLARMILLWAALPLGLISMGSSKLFHYAYPFLPPFALALGWFVSDVTRWIDERLSTVLRLRSNDESPRWRVAQRLIAAGAVFFLVVAVWTIAAGQLLWKFDGQTLLRNSSFIRPILVAAVLLIIAGYRRAGLRTGIAAAFVVILPPIQGYHRILDRMTTPDRPLRVISDCAAKIRHSGAAVGDGFYNAATLVADHPYFYYLRAVGPWQVAEHPDDDLLRQRLFVAGAQTPIMLSRKDYELLTVRVDRLWTEANAARPPLTGIAIERDASVVVLLPGPYAACVAPAVTAGGEEVGDNPQRRSQWR